MRWQSNGGQALFDILAGQGRNLRMNGNVVEWDGDETDWPEFVQRLFPARQYWVRQI